MAIDTTSSRDLILDKIKNGKPHLLKLPNVPMFAYTGDLLEGFTQRLNGLCRNILV